MEKKSNASGFALLFFPIDIVNIGWHIYLKDITAYAASPSDS